MAALIDEWCNQQRTLVLAWRECHLLAARNPLFIDLWQQWCALWRDTWAAICDSFGGAQHADTVACFFDSESQLNLVHWRPLLDRACLGEICIGVVNWLKGIPTTEGVWRRHARDAALQAVSRISVADEITERKLAKSAAPRGVRKPPEILVFTFIILKSCSARLLVKGTAKSVRNRRVASLKVLNRMRRL